MKKKYGFWEVLKIENGKWLCRCQCGKEKIIRRDWLVKGRTKSCGCKRGIRLMKHGLARYPIYSIWKGMTEGVTILYPQTINITAAEELKFAENGTIPKALLMI